MVEEDVPVGSPVEGITRDVASGLYRNGRVWEPRKRLGHSARKLSSNKWSSMNPEYYASLSIALLPWAVVHSLVIQYHKARPHADDKVRAPE